MNNPWHSLEDVPAHSAAAVEWKQDLGDAFEAVKEAFLQKAKRKASSVRCPHREGCAHELKPRGRGFIGKCKDDDGQGCDDITMKAKEAEVWEVNLKRLGTAIASALKCDVKDEKLDFDRTRQIASLGSGPLPILLSVQHDAEGFGNVVAWLVARWPKGFILLAPTSRFCTATATDMLGRANAGFFDLKTHVELLHTGELKAPKSGAELFAPFVGPAGTTKAATDGRIKIGRLEYDEGFSDVWFRGEHYNLRERAKARACIQFLADGKSFDRKSALHFEKEIDPHVREQCKLEPLPGNAETKIHHYFNPSKSKTAKLGREIIKSAGRGTGRYFLNVE